MQRENLKQKQVRINADLHKKLKIRAVKTDSTISNIAEKICSNYLEAAKESSSDKKL